jgi:hypothetical protein
MKAWKLAPLAAALTSASAFAVEPVGMGLGNGVTFLPSVDVTVSNNDNIYLQSGGKEVDSTITRIAPALGLTGDMGKVNWQANYRAEQGVFSNDEDDDYLDQKIDVAAGFAINSRNEIDVKAAFNADHDNRGAGTTEGDAALSVVDPDEFEETTAGLKYTFGADSSFANIEVEADSYQKRYTNNKVDKDGNATGIESRDHNKMTGSAALKLNLSPATKALLELSQSTVSYEEDSADKREGDILKVLVGASWDITGKTSGEFKIGSANRDFKNSDVESNTRLSWSGNVSWSPLTYSTLTLSTSQNNNETNGAGNYIANTNTVANWNHTFSTFISAGVEASRASDEYVGDDSVSGAARKDETISYGVNVTYSPKTWVDIKASLKQSDRDSNNDTLDYDSQVVNLGVTLAL